MSAPRLGQVDTCAVCLCTFNGTLHLDEQIGSLFHQSRSIDQILINDDCSEDSTLQLANSYAAQRNNVIVHRNDMRLGYAQNFGAALSQLHADVIFLSDQDDYWLPTKIERVCEVFEQLKDVDLVIHDLEYCDAQLHRTGITKLSRLNAVGDPMQSYVVGMATAVRRSFLELCLPIPDVPGLSHDRWLHDCARVLGRKKILPEVLALYRRHGGNATADNPINSAASTTRWRLRWQLLKRRLLPSASEALPQHFPLLDWLEQHRHTFVERGYLGEATVAALIAEHASRKEAILRRAALTRLPRWRRWFAVLRLYAQGGYRHHFTWRSAVGDALRGAGARTHAASSQ